MSLETVTKESWDKTFKEAITNAEEEIKTYMTLYRQLLDMRSKYRKEYKEYRIKHLVDLDKGIITYELGTKRKIGYDYKGKK